MTGDRMLRRIIRMPVPPRMRAAQVHGFTLLEVLVVLVIMAIIATLAVLRMPSIGGGSQLDEQMRRLTTLMQLAGEEALLQGRNLGLRIDREGYRFLYFDLDTRTWQDLDLDETFRSRALPEGVEIELVLEGRDVVVDSDDEDEEKLPQILIQASGEVTPFEMTIRSEFADYQYLVTGLPYGGTEIDLEDTTF